jgi:hypothetical protein
MDFLKEILNSMGIKKENTDNDENIRSYLKKNRGIKGNNGFYAEMNLFVLKTFLLSFAIYNRDIVNEKVMEYVELIKNMIINEGVITFDTPPIILVDKFKNINYGIVADGQHRLQAIKYLIENSIAKCPSCKVEKLSIEVIVKEVKNKEEAMEIIKRNNLIQLSEDEVTKKTHFSKLVDKLNEVEPDIVGNRDKRPYINEKILYEKFSKRYRNGEDPNIIIQKVLDTNAKMIVDFDKLNLREFQKKYNATGYGNTSTRMKELKIVLGIDNEYSYL